MKKGSGTFVPNGNESIHPPETSKEGRGTKERPIDLKDPAVQALRDARRKSPYYDQGGDCNW